MLQECAEDREQDDQRGGDIDGRAENALERHVEVADQPVDAVSPVRPRRGQRRPDQRIDDEAVHLAVGIARHIREDRLAAHASGVPVSRYLGVAFAGSHLVHAGFIIASVILSSARFKAGVARTPEAVYILDTIAYGFVIAMAITSFDRIANRMQYATWRRLHVTGNYVIWLTFFVAYWRRGITYPLFYGPFLLIVLAALVIRAVGKAKRTNVAEG